MGFSKFVEIGRVAQIKRGELEGELVVVLDIMNLNRVLVEGQNVKRMLIPIRHLSLESQKVNILRGSKSALVHKAIQKHKVEETFAKTNKAQKQARQNKRAQLNDFQRFQAMVLKRKLSTMLKAKIAK